MSGSRLEVLARQEPAGPAATPTGSRRRSSGCRARDRALHAGQERGPRDDVTALALHRARRDGGDRAGSTSVANARRSSSSASRPEPSASVRPVRIVNGDAVDLGRERPEPLLVRRVPAGKRHREQRPPVEPALEAQDRVTTGGGLRELDGVLDRLGPRVEQGDFAVAPDEPTSRSRARRRLVRDDREVGMREARRLRAAPPRRPWGASARRGGSRGRPDRSIIVLPSTSVNTAPIPLSMMAARAGRAGRRPPAPCGR